MLAFVEVNIITANPSLLLKYVPRFHLCSVLLTAVPLDALENPSATSLLNGFTHFFHDFNVRHSDLHASYESYVLRISVAKY
jgi:hypothetical protein